MQPAKCWIKKLVFVESLSETGTSKYYSRNKKMSFQNPTHIHKNANNPKSSLLSLSQQCDSLSFSVKLRSLLIQHSFFYSKIQGAAFLMSSKPQQIKGIVLQLLYNWLTLMTVNLPVLKKKNSKFSIKLSLIHQDLFLVMERNARFSSCLFIYLS